MERPDCDGCGAIVRSRVGRGFGDSDLDFCHHCLTFVEGALQP